MTFAFKNEECLLPSSDVIAPAFGIEAGATAVELPVAMSEEGKFGEEAAQLSISSTWQLTGVFAGSEFGYL